MFNKLRTKIAKAFMPVNLKQGININTAYSSEQGQAPLDPKFENQNQRGIQIYYMSSLAGVTGKDKQGSYLQTRI